MSNKEKPQKFNIDNLNDEECRDLLLKIKEIVSSFPTFCVSHYDAHDDYGHYDAYGCCGEPYYGGHDVDCAIRKLNSIFLA